MIRFLVVTLLGLCSGSPCRDREPLPPKAPAKDCADAKAKGLCESMAHKAEWYCPQTCDLCVSDTQDNQCTFKGESYDHLYQACYDECHKDCEGKKWICWRGQWYAKGECGPGDGDHCTGDHGKIFPDGFHACFDKCYPKCKGNKWICWRGEWEPKGRCSAASKAQSANDDPAYEWSTFRGASYMRLARMPQSEMKDACQAVGAFPVTISDAAEENFVRQLCGSYGPCWIGLAEPSHSENWFWMDGRSPHYLNWQEGEPNNWDHVDENAAMMSYPPGSRNGKWFDAPSSWDRPVAICKRSGTPVGTSSSGNPLVWMLLGAIVAALLAACFYVHRNSQRRRNFAESDEALVDAGVE